MEKKYDITVDDLVFTIVMEFGSRLFMNLTAQELFAKEKKQIYLPMEDYMLFRQYINEESNERSLVSTVRNLLQKNLGDIKENLKSKGLDPNQNEGVRYLEEVLQSTDDQFVKALEIAKTDIAKGIRWYEERLGIKYLPSNN